MVGNLVAIQFSCRHSFDFPHKQYSVRKVMWISIPLSPGRKRAVEQDEGIHLAHPDVDEAKQKFPAVVSTRVLNSAC